MPYNIVAFGDLCSGQASPIGIYEQARQYAACVGLNICLNEANKTIRADTVYKKHNREII